MYLRAAFFRRSAAWIRGISNNKAGALGCILSPLRLCCGWQLVRQFGKGNWFKRKGTASVMFEDGTIAHAELHWFEAHGIGKRNMRIKRRLK
jgi:hypothetical protein